MFPWIGRQPIRSLTVSQLNETVERVQRRGVIATAHRVRPACSKVFCDAIAWGLCAKNGAVEIGRGPAAGLHQTHGRRHRSQEGGPPAAFDRRPRGLPDVVRGPAMGAACVPVSRSQRTLEWVEVALHAAVWTIAAAKIKRGMVEKAQRVPMTCRWLSQFAEQRRALMQPWADYLARLCKGAEVLPFRKTA